MSIQDACLPAPGSSASGTEAASHLRPPGYDPSRIRRVFSKQRHPADGLVASVDMGGGAHMTIPDPGSYENGGIVWRLTWGNPASVALTAGSIITSYDYLLSDYITTKEAIARLRVLRAARKHLCTPAQCDKWNELASRDSDEHPRGEDAQRLSGEAMSAQAEGIAQ